MRPNDGREAAYVRSRVIDKSLVPASTEYLPLFTCLAPKGTSTEPVLIRQVDDLLNEFGDPSINPILYRDLITIRDFVLGGRSCWVNRVPVNAQKFHYYFYLNNTLPLVYMLYFTYPKWNTLTTEEKRIANAGYLDGGSSVIRFQDHLGNYLDVDIFTEIYDIVSKKEEIFEKTGWVVDVPENPLIRIAEKHNSLQQFTTSVNNGRKYITMRWQGTYSTPEKHILTSTVYVQPVDSDGKIIRDSDGHLIRPDNPNYISHFKQTVVPVKVLEGVVDAYIGTPEHTSYTIPTNVLQSYIYKQTNHLYSRERSITVEKPTNPEPHIYYLEPAQEGSNTVTIGKTQEDGDGWIYLHTVNGSTSSSTRVSNAYLRNSLVADERYKDCLEFTNEFSRRIKVKDDYSQDTITVSPLDILIHNKAINSLSFTPNYVIDPNDPSKNYLRVDGATYVWKFPNLSTEGLTITFSQTLYQDNPELMFSIGVMCTEYYTGPTTIEIPQFDIFEGEKIPYDKTTHTYFPINTESNPDLLSLTFTSYSGYYILQNVPRPFPVLQDNHIKIGMANSSGTGDVYQKIKLPADTYNQSGARYIIDKLIHVFYKANRYTESKLRKRKVYSNIPTTNEEWEDYLVPESKLIDGTEYYTNEKDSTSIERTEPNWQTFIYSSSSPNIPKAPLYRLYYTSTSSSNYYYNAAFEICDSNYNLIYSIGANLLYVDDFIINSLIPRTLYRGEEAEDFSVYFPYSYWSEIEDYLKDNFDIEMHYPDGFSSSETHLTSFDTTLIPELSAEDLLLFSMDSMLYQDSNILTITSVTKLKPASAGLRIKYVLQGYDFSYTNFLIEETITLPDHFTNQQFADAMNENPYVNVTVDDPEADNIYRNVIAGYFSNLAYTVHYDLDVEITLEDYQKAIKVYSDSKYYGNFIADLTYPLVRWYENPDPDSESYYEIYVMPENDRRAIHWTMKEIAATRKDLICIFSTPNLPLDQACNWVAAKGDYADYWEYGTFQTLEYPEQAFYCEMYYGWFSYKTALVSGQPYKIKEVNSTLFVIANIIDAWNNKGISFPVAGDQGGVLNSNIDYISILDNPDTKQKKDKLVSYRINPIWDTGTRGIQIYGNETLNPLYTDLSSAHIARMLVQIRNQIDTYTESIKFSLNNKYTWGSWINNVSTKILDPLKAQGGLVWYSVKMGTDTTTPEQIAQRRINGIVSLQFRPDLEIIDLEYTVYSSALDMVEVSSSIVLL